MLIIKSFCPPSHRWASPAQHSTDLSLTSQVLRGSLGRRGIKITSTGHWGSSGINSWTPPLLYIHYIIGIHHSGTWFQLYLLFQADDPTVPVWISDYLMDISARMKEQHLQLNLAKTELLIFPSGPLLQHQFTIQQGLSTIFPMRSARNLRITSWLLKIMLPK